MRPRRGIATTMTRTPEATFTPTGGLDRVPQAPAAVTLASELRHNASTTGTKLLTPSNSDDILHTEP